MKCCTIIIYVIHDYPEASDRFSGVQNHWGGVFISLGNATMLVTAVYSHKGNGCFRASKSPTL